MNYGIRYVTEEAQSLGVVLPSMELSTFLSNQPVKNNR